MLLLRHYCNSIKIHTCNLHFLTPPMLQMFANHEERCVHFEQPSSWVIGEGGLVKFTLDSDVVTSPADYIAIYKVLCSRCGTSPRNNTDDPLMVLQNLTNI